MLSHSHKLPLREKRTLRKALQSPLLSFIRAGSKGKTRGDCQPCKKPLPIATDKGCYDHPKAYQCQKSDWNWDDELIRLFCERFLQKILMLIQTSVMCGERGSKFVKFSSLSNSSRGFLSLVVPPGIGSRLLACKESERYSFPFFYLAGYK